MEADEQITLHIRMPAKLRESGNKRARQCGLTLPALVRILLKKDIEIGHDLIIPPTPAVKRRTA